MFRTVVLSAAGGGAFFLRGFLAWVGLVESVVSDTDTDCTLAASSNSSDSIGGMGSSGGGSVWLLMSGMVSMSRAACRTTGGTSRLTVSFGAIATTFEMNVFDTFAWAWTCPLSTNGAVRDGNGVFV